jgi:hypothetical protein
MRDDRTLFVFVFRNEHASDRRSAFRNLIVRLLRALSSPTSSSATSTPIDLPDYSRS